MVIMLHFQTNESYACLDYRQDKYWNMIGYKQGSIFVDPLFGSIDPLFSYRSLPLRPYKTSEIAARNLDY